MTETPKRMTTACNNRFPMYLPIQIPPNMFLFAPATPPSAPRKAEPPKTGFLTDFAYHTKMSLQLFQIIKNLACSPKSRYRMRSKKPASPLNFGCELQAKPQSIGKPLGLFCENMSADIKREIPPIPGIQFVNTESSVGQNGNEGV